VKAVLMCRIPQRAASEGK